MFQQFYLPTDDEAMMREIEKRVQKKVQIPDDPLGAISSFHNGLKSIFQLIRDCGSTLLNTPQLVVTKYINIIKTKGSAAQMTTKAVNNKIRRMMGNPHVEFKRLDRRFTTEELDEIQAKRLHSLEAEIFTLITALMVNDTRQGEILFQFDDLAELKRLMIEDISEESDD
jgi:hypothetical protein